MDVVNAFETTETLTLVLNRTATVSSITDTEVNKVLDKLYNGGTLNITKYLGSIINASILQKMPCFMMSRSIITELVNNDNNIDKKYKPLQNKHYSELLKRMIQSGLFEELRKASKVGSGKKIAGLYRIKSIEFRELFKDDIIQREQSIVKEYYSYQNIPLKEDQFPNIFLKA